MRAGSLCVAAFTLVACGPQAAPVVSDSASTREQQSEHLARTMAYECGDSFSFVARILGDTAWAFLSGRTVALPRAPGTSEAQYKKADTVLWIEGEKARLQHSGADLECVNDPRTAIWEHAKLSGADFRATGNEPGWHLEIYPDSIMLTAGYGAEVYGFSMPLATAQPESVRTMYETLNEFHSLSVMIEGRRCSDTMSGEEFEVTVTVTLDDRIYHGCGRALH